MSSAKSREEKVESIPGGLRWGVVIAVIVFALVGALIYYIGQDKLTVRVIAIVEALLALIAGLYIRYLQEKTP